MAKALAVLPRLSAAMQSGEVSYAKVRAVTRVATPENEAQLVDVARCGTAAHVERLTRAWRRVDRIEAARQTEVRHLERHLTTWVDDDGMVVLRGRLTPEVGAVVQRALEAAADQLFQESAQAPRGDTLAEDVTAGQRRADALGLLAECALSADLDRGTAGDRYQVVLHVDIDGASHDATGSHAATDVRSSTEDVSAETRPVIARQTSFDEGSWLSARRTQMPCAVEQSSRQNTVEEGVDAADASEHADAEVACASSAALNGRLRIRSVAVPGVVERPSGHAVLEVADSAAYVSAETYERLSCDASVVVMRHHADGSVLDAGRRTRSIPPAIRRALMARDPRCQFPGCTTRRCDAHHLTHWAHGGATSLDNLVHVCRWHHRLVHEGGYRIARDASGDVRVSRPEGTPLSAVPRPPRWTRQRDEDPLGPTAARLAAAGLSIGPYTATPLWDGHPFDVGWAIDVLHGHPVLITPPRALPPLSMSPESQPVTCGHGYRARRAGAFNRRAATYCSTPDRPRKSAATERHRGVTVLMRGCRSRGEGASVRCRGCTPVTTERTVRHACGRIRSGGIHDSSRGVQGSPQGDPRFSARGARFAARGARGGNKSCEINEYEPAEKWWGSFHKVVGVIPESGGVVLNGGAPRSSSCPPLSVGCQADSYSVPPSF